VDSFKNLSYKILLIFFVILVIPAWTQTQILDLAKPETVGISPKQLKHVDKVINGAITNKQIPGAVLLVGRHGKIVKRQAYGKSQLIPVEKKMAVGQIFDLASVTKPIATATSVMKLIEAGKLRLFDKVNQYIPEFSTYVDKSGKKSSPAKIYHLLTHTSGLSSYTNSKKVKQRYGSICPDSLVLYIAKLKKVSPPGEDFRYSCLGFITLCEIVKRVAGIPLNQFAQENIFTPLGMQKTSFKPAQKWCDQIVPTQVFDGKPLIGLVHDPLAQLMGGISGNAGLFSSADDLAIFAQMMLQKGIFNNVRILNPLSVKLMTSIYDKVGFAGRGLGWDLNSDYSSNRGDIFPIGGFGHTGYTGTSIWIDPGTETFVIFLTNRVHPNDKGSVVALRSYVANCVAAAIY